MCGLYGFFNYGGAIKCLSTLTNCLAEQAAVRGTDAAGIAYNNKGRVVIHKEPKASYLINFKHPDDTVCVTGHTRHATQGNKKHNYNNHPFGGSCKNLRFALCHNGVLTNDTALREDYHLPKTKIATDSYVAVQLLERQKKLNSETIKSMSETVHGSFSFTILDGDNTLWLVRGDSPLSLIHLPKYHLYVYASTEEILYKALVDTKLFEEIKTGNFEEIPIHEGDILNILPDGTVVDNKFNYTDYSYYGRCHWWDYGDYDNGSYIDELKSIAAYQGYSAEEIDELLAEGFTQEEIEDFIYCCE